MPIGAREVHPLDMAAAYAAIANDGVRNAPYFVDRVEDSAGNNIFEHQAQGERVMSAQSARLVTQTLALNVKQGTGERAKVSNGQPAAGKTGTSNQAFAIWFVGYTPQLATAVWMGHADGLKPLRGVNGVGAVTGGSHPAVAWQEFMTNALEGTDVIEFPVPAKIVPRARTAAEVVRIRPREETVAGRQQDPEVLEPNCGGEACERPAEPIVPSLPSPQVPATDRTTGSAPPGPSTSNPGTTPTVPSTAGPTTTRSPQPTMPPTVPATPDPSTTVTPSEQR
jgi:membrane peptidoglycan carboxypeptidase